MTPEQIQALQTVSGATLTQEHLDALEPFVLSRNDVAIAEMLPKKQVINSRLIGIGSILAALAPSGGAFLDGLEAIAASDPNIKWTLKLIEADNFDVGMPVVRAMLKQFAEDHPTLAPAITILLGLAVTEESSYYNAVSDALNIAEGRNVL